MVIKSKEGHVCFAIGRNGRSLVHGIDYYINSAVDADGQTFTTVDIRPINSKGDTTKCSIEIPLEVLVELYKQITEDEEFQHPGASFKV